MCFQYDKAYQNFKNLPKVLNDESFSITKNLKHGYQRCLALIVSKFF